MNARKISVSRNIREGYYGGRFYGGRNGHSRISELGALRRWAPVDPWVVDKAKYPEGEWLLEPDYQSFWVFDRLHCVILRTRHSGSLCGYVGVPFGHPWWGKQYSDTVAPTREQIDTPVDMDKTSVISLLCAAASGDDIETSARIDCLIHVHGGLTYSAPGWRAAGESPRLWYFGFDCSHYRDLSPGSMARYPDLYSFSDGDYRDMAYVMTEVGSLSLQLAAVK